MDEMKDEDDKNMGIIDENKDEEWVEIDIWNDYDMWKDVSELGDKY